MVKVSVDDFDFYEIDESRLEEEWDKQLKLNMRYTIAVADANKRVEQAKAAVDVAKAELERKIRSDPDKYCGGDSRDGAIKAEITIRLARHSATKKLISAKHHQDIMQGALAVVESRKYAIQDKVKLFLGNYFAEPRVKGEDQQEAKNKLKQRRAAKRTQS